jgi:hypothetical protein
MASDIHQAEVCLGSYLKRGQQALTYLEKGEIDKALESLKWRRAAFFNFKVADRHATKVDTDYLQRDEFQALWSEIQMVDRNLDGQLKYQINTMKKRILDTNCVKGKIQRFHSGLNPQPGVVGSV